MLIPGNEVYNLGEGWGVVTRVFNTVEVKWDNGTIKQYHEDQLISKQSLPTQGISEHAPDNG